MRGRLAAAFASLRDEGRELTVDETLALVAESRGRAGRRPLEATPAAAASAILTPSAAP